MMHLKMDFKIVLSTLFITALICGCTFADKATVERIRKHQEWLRQRSQGRQHLFATAKPKKSVELLNLWRFNKNENINSINDVYPENDNVLIPTTTPSSATIATTTSLAINTALNATTNKIMTPKSETSTLSTLMTPKPLVPTSTAKTVRTTNDSLYNSISHLDSNFYVKSSTANDWLSNEILETTTPFTNTISTSNAAITTSTTTAATTTTTLKITTRKPKPRPYPRWANWGEWSDCSRSCGGGIKHQLRKCINR